MKYRVQIRRTTIEKGWLEVEADSPQAAIELAGTMPDPEMYIEDIISSEPTGLVEDEDGEEVTLA